MQRASAPAPHTPGAKKSDLSVTQPPTKVSKSRFRHYRETLRCGLGSLKSGTERSSNCASPNEIFKQTIIFHKRQSQYLKLCPIFKLMTKKVLV